MNLAKADARMTRDYVTAAEQPEQPLTLEINNRIADLTAQADEITHRLYTLRDRLFGAVPEGVAGRDPRPPGADCFESGAKLGLGLLADALTEIDRLSLTIANRL